MIDLTLPASSSPATDHYRNEERDLLPFALYVHQQFSDAEFAELLRACNSEHGEEVVHLAPRHNLVNQPLRAAYDRHLDDVAPAGEYDPIYFAAVVDKDWKKEGVLMVTLDTSEGDTCIVDQLRVPAEVVGINLVNLQISNIDWEEMRDEYADQVQTGDDDQPPAPHDDVDPGYHMTDEDYNDGASPNVPGLGYWVGLYAVPDIDFKKLMLELDTTGNPYPELMVRPEGRVSAERAVEEAVRLHPMRCARNIHLCRSMLLIADSMQYHEKGLLFVDMEWDQKVDESMEILVEKGSSARTDTRRLPVNSHETLTLFNMVVKGYTPFKSNEPAFIFYDESKVWTSNSTRFLDKGAARRLSGMHRFLQGSFESEVQTRKELDKDLSIWEQVIRRHPLQAYRERFHCTLQPQYFVYADTELKSGKDMVVLAKSAWSGKVEDMTEQEKGGMVIPDGALLVTTMHLPASEAYSFLVDVVEGRKLWAPEQSEASK